jgi:predicted AlkP superfamily phosphohydrolase/phosphomutase
VGHYFWGFPNGHRGSVSASLPQLATTLKDVYKAIDREIGKIIEGLDEEVTLVVLSGQGMGSNTAKWHLIPEVLSRLGFLATKDDRKSSAGTNWLAEIRNSIPLEWRRSVSRHLPGRLRDRLRVHWANGRIDWTRTRAFHLPTDLLGYIRINLKGREPQGIVEPGSEYDDLCSQVSEALKELVHPHTGKPIVREIFHTDQTFPGPQRNRLPDLIVTWLDDSEINDEGYSKEIGTINGNLPDPRSGNHRPEGFAIFYGPGITKGQVSQGHITDIAPTILKYFGLTPPSTIDGRNLIEDF